MRHSKLRDFQKLMLSKKMRLHRVGDLHVLCKPISRSSKYIFLLC